MNSIKSKSKWIAYLMMTCLTLSSTTLRGTELTPEQIQDCLMCRKRERATSEALYRAEGRLFECRGSQLDLKTELHAERAKRKNAEAEASAWYRNPWIMLGAGVLLGGWAASGASR